MKIHNLHYLVLCIILATGALLFFLGSGQPPLQLAVGILTAVSYVAWGIIHHVLSGDLHTKIVLEYMLIGGIAIVLIVTMFG